MSAETLSNVFSQEEEMLIKQAYDQLIKEYLESNHRRKVEVIDRAFALAYKAHYGVRRRSGEPYILHPIAVAHIVCHEIGLGSTSIACALMHDVVEDTDYTVEDLRALFGDKIAQIVDGLTKISGEVFSSNISVQAENFRKLILTMNDDVRVILIKIADRLHNMRTLSSMLPAKQYKIAGETLYVYAPLAHRLGLFAIKSELEDLSFRYEHPEVYKKISQEIEQTAQERTALFEEFIAPLKLKFAEMGLRYEIKKRLKSIYSIWQKMEKKQIPFEEVYDLYAVRIIFESEEGISDKNRCWDIYTAITDIYRNRPDRIRDWISNPKSNGYQALHLTVMGPRGHWVEVQIRSRKMDEIAEKGFAAHWKYKEEGVEEDSELEKWLQTIREILENPTPNAMDFLDTIKLNLYSSDILVFTPKGDSIKIPLGASVLDFAYTIHSDLGDHCIGAKVNHRIVPISHKLGSGDQVEILDSKNAHPQHEWLDYVVTAKAKYQIDQALRRQNRAYIQEGEAIVKDKLIEAGEEPSTTIYDRIASFYGFSRRTDFFLSVGNGSIDLSEALHEIINHEEQKTGFFGRMLSSIFGRDSKREAGEAAPIDKKKDFELKEIDGRANYKVASCCHPIPGDDVIGIIGSDSIVEVHKRNCPNAMKLKSSQGDKLLSVYWDEHSQKLFDVQLWFKGIDSSGILLGIVSMLTLELKIPLKAIDIHSEKGLFEGDMTISVRNKSEVDRVIQALIKAKKVLNINRIID